jgi:hypothetical protein
MLKNTTVHLVNKPFDVNSAIADAFKNDYDLPLFFDPNSKAVTEEQRIAEIQQKCLAEMASHKCQFYIIKYGSLNIGYWLYNIDTKRIVSFGLKPIYRKDVHLYRWMKHVHGQMFWIALYSKNVRAIKYLEKNGMHIIREEDGVTYLEN